MTPIPKITFAVIIALLPSFDLHADEVAKVSSPDAKNTITVNRDDSGILSYQLSRNGQTLIANSMLGLRSTDHNFSQGLKVASTAIRTVNETYTLPSGKTSTYTDHCNQLTVKCTKDNYTFSIIFRAYNDGIAFRYAIDGKGDMTIKADSSEVTIPSLATCWAQQYASSYEQKYVKRTWAETAALDNHKMGAPVLVKSSLGNDAWCLITESANTGNFCTSAILSGEKSEVGNFNYGMDSDASITLPFSSPWRTVYIGTLETIVESTLNENLCPKSTIEDTGWIHPGLSSWDWGSQDGSQVHDLSLIKTVIDEAYVMGWPYMTLDDGWASSSYRLRDVIDYAAAKGVKVIIWTNQNRFENNEENIRSILHNWKQLGFAGTKIDFFEGDSQDMMKKYERILKAAADEQMIVTFHGSTKPSGLRRTYPNMLSSEAVYGNEMYFYIHEATPAEHNIMLTLTRNVIGAMEYTPGEFATKTGWIRSNTTWSHQAALITLFESAIQTIADSYDNIVYNVEAPLWKVLPASWDETRCIEADPEEYVTLRRRSGDDWYIASISRQARKVVVPLSFLGDGEYTAQIYKDGTCSSDIAYEETRVTASSTLSVDVKATGGFTVRISKNPIEQPKFTVVECEDAKRTGGITETSDSKGIISGGKYIGFVGNGNAITNTITVDEAGPYDLTIFYISGESRDAYVQVNGSDKNYYTFNGTTWGVDGLAFKTVQVELAAGDNTVTIGNDKGWGPDFDRLVFSPARDYRKVEVTAIGDFSDKSGYGSQEPVTITVKNTSNENLTDVPVSYTVNGKTPVTETISSLEAGETKSYTFSQTADLKEINTYVIEASVNNDLGQRLVGDMLSTTFTCLPAEDAISWASKGGSVNSYSAQINSNEAATMLIDDNDDTKWCEVSNSEPWVVIQLPDLYDISYFLMRDCKTKESYGNIDWYEIYLSTDNVNWTKVVTTCDRKTENIKIDRITPTTAKYVKLVLHRPENDSAIRVYAFDVYGTRTKGTDMMSPTAEEDASGNVYSVSGQRINESYKGIVIKNGKKVIQR